MPVFEMRDSAAQAGQGRALLHFKSYLYEFHSRMMTESITLMSNSEGWRFLKYKNSPDSPLPTLTFHLWVREKRKRRSFCPIWCRSQELKIHSDPMWRSRDKDLDQS